MLFGVISVIFLGAGLTVNFLELLAFILIRPFSLSLFRRVNAFLCYLFWSIFTWVLDYWGSQEMRIFSDEDLSYEELSRFNKVAILNHRGDIDWMLGIALCDRLGILQSVKCVTKDFAKYLPTMGWNFWFSEFAFLKRKFEADHSRLAEAARCWNSYDFPWTLCFYPEGTRFTEEKHQKSCEYARKKGLPELKHHLLPRTKGFNILIREFKDHVPYVYDITFGYPHGIVTLMNLAQGQKVYADVYLRRIPVSEIPMGSEEETSKWLIDLFKEKDRMVDYHSIHGQFPFPLVHISTPIYPYVVMTMWALLLLVTFLWAVYGLIIAGAYWKLTMVGVTFLTAFFGLHHICMIVNRVKGSQQPKKKAT